MSSMNLGSRDPSYVILELFYVTMQADDSGLASYVAGQIDRSLSWKVC